MATYDEADVVARVWMLLRDVGQTATEQLLTDTEIIAIGCRGAEQHYSRLNSAVAVSNLTANGTAFLALPVGYIDGFSSIVSVETPPDMVPAEIMDSRAYRVARDGSGALRFVWDSPPANAATVRVAYSVPRIMAANAVNTTIPDHDFTAFCDLAASICADSIAAKYARTSEPAFNADAVNYRTRAMEWRDVAKRLWERWEQAMGIGSSGDGGSSSVAAASGWANWDIASSYGAGISHPRFSR